MTRNDLLTSLELGGQDLSNWKLRRQILIIGLLAGVGLILIEEISPTTFQFLITVSPILGGLGGLGTVILAMLYARQKDILSTQLELQRIEHNATIQSDRIRGESELYDDSSSRYIIELSNVGKGVAGNLKLRIDPQTDQVKERPVTTTQDLIRERGTRGEDWINPRSAYLNPGENQVAFRCHAAVKMSNSANPQGSVFEAATAALQRQGVNKMRIKLFVEYEQADGTADEDQVLDHVVPLKGRTDLRIALLRGLPHGAPNLESRLNNQREKMEADSGAL